MATILEIRCETLKGAIKHYKDIMANIKSERGNTPIHIIKQCTSIYNHYHDKFGIEFLENVNDKRAV